MKINSLNEQDPLTRVPACKPAGITGAQLRAIAHRILCASEVTEACGAAAEASTAMNEALKGVNVEAKRGPTESGLSMLMRAGRERDERVRAWAHKGQTAIAEQFYRFAQESEALGHGRETARGTLAHEEAFERAITHGEAWLQTNIEDWPEAKAWFSGAVRGDVTIGVDPGDSRDDHTDVWEWWGPRRNGKATAMREKNEEMRRMLENTVCAHDRITGQRLVVHHTPERESSLAVHMRCEEEIRKARRMWRQRRCRCCGGDDFAYPNPTRAYYSDPLQYDVKCRGCGWVGLTTTPPPK